MTRKYPLAVDVEPTVEKPDTPLWEGMLEDGDLLYIPRGWWHVATPLDEPTLHLTVGVNNVDRRGSVELVRESDAIQRGRSARPSAVCLARRADRSYGEAASDAHRRVAAGIAGPAIWPICDSRSQPRARMNLPWRATPDILPPPDERFCVRWSSPRLPKVTDADGEIHVVARGRRWRFAKAAALLIDKLVSGRSYTVAELITDDVPNRQFGCSFVSWR